MMRFGDRAYRWKWRLRHWWFDRAGGARLKWMCVLCVTALALTWSAHRIVVLAFASATTEAPAP